MLNLIDVRHQIITMNSSINTLSYSRKVNGQSINCVIQWSTEVFVDNNNNFGQGIDAQITIPYILGYKMDLMELYQFQQNIAYVEMLKQEQEKQKKNKKKGKEEEKEEKKESRSKFMVKYVQYLAEHYDEAFLFEAFIGFTVYNMFLGKIAGI